MSHRTRETLRGWGLTSPVVANVTQPADPREVANAITSDANRGVIPRGLGRSYGDSAQRAGGTVISSIDLRRSPTVEVDDATSKAALTAGAGWSLRELLDHVVPKGWFLPVVPGTADITFGGAIAADVHGKNHHVDASFGTHLSAIELVTPDGTQHRLRPGDASAASFWSTVGGMGLTGVVVEATIGLAPIDGPNMEVTTQRTPDLESTMQRLSEADETSQHTVAWLDLADVHRRGRGVVQSGNHSNREAPNRSAAQPRSPLSTPAMVGLNLVRPSVTRSFNTVWWRRARVEPQTEVIPYRRFLHPLDAVPNWNRVYGHRGFVQWQMVVPDEHADVVELCAARLSTSKVSPSLAVLKRFGEPSQGPLSFPLPGWTLAVDIACTDTKTAALLDALDELVTEAGGRIYLAKDSRCRPELISTMYPRLGEWQQEQNRLDPTGAMASDQSKRLGLVL